MAAAASGAGTCRGAVPGAARSQSPAGGGGSGRGSRWRDARRRTASHLVPGGRRIRLLSCHDCGEGLAGGPGAGAGAGRTGGQSDTKDGPAGDRNAVCSASPGGCLRGGLGGWWCPRDDQVVGWESPWVRVGAVWAQGVRVESLAEGLLRGLGSRDASGRDPFH